MLFQDQHNERSKWAATLTNNLRFEELIDVLLGHFVFQRRNTER